MEILLRNKQTGMYFEGVDDWTRHLDRAFNFQTPERVVRFVRATLLDPARVEIVFGFPNPCYNFALPIDARFDAKGSAVLAAPSAPAAPRETEL